LQRIAAKSLDYPAYWQPHYIIEITNIFNTHGSYPFLYGGKIGFVKRLVTLFT
jgi:hypothetical protein